MLLALEEQELRERRRSHQRSGSAHSHQGRSHGSVTESERIAELKKKLMKQKDLIANCVEAGDVPAPPARSDGSPPDNLVGIQLPVKLQRSPGKVAKSPTSDLSAVFPGDIVRMVAKVCGYDATVTKFLLVQYICQK